MNIDKYLKGGGYYDEDGCFYENAEDFITIRILGFCGCGDPDEAAKFVLKALRVLNERDWDVRNNFIEDDGLEYFVWYMLDDKGLTEHGSSVGGAWLTKKGQEVLEDLEELYK